MKPGLGILGDISISGTLKRSVNFMDKVAMLSENGAKLILTPIENCNEMKDIPPSILKNSDISFYSDSKILIKKIFSKF